MIKTLTKMLSVVGCVLTVGVSGAVCQTATPSPAHSPKETRVVVIANTNAEADGLMAVLNTADLRPTSLHDAPKPAENTSSHPPNHQPV